MIGRTQNHLSVLEVPFIAIRALRIGKPTPTAGDAWSIANRTSPVAQIGGTEIRRRSHRGVLPVEVTPRPKIRLACCQSASETQEEKRSSVKTTSGTE